MQTGTLYNYFYYTRRKKVHDNDVMERQFYSNLDYNDKTTDYPTETITKI